MTNPYNCTMPGKLFVGYERLREELLNGFINGNSYAVLGGRRCGKTSFLIQTEKDLKEKGLTNFHVIPLRFSVQEMSDISPNLLFEKIYCLTIGGTDAPQWTEGRDGKEYENFLSHLDKAESFLEKKYGADWLVILMIDEMDAALTMLKDDFFFQNLRNFLMESRFNRHFRVLATGVKDMAQLITSGSSPLNNLRSRHLGILTESSAKKLVGHGFENYAYHPEYLRFLFRLSGRHPYILQGILENLWQPGPREWDKKSIKDAFEKFHKERGGDFRRWEEAFGIAERAVYRCLAEDTKGKRHISDIRCQLDMSLRPELDQSLAVLSYHGVIDDSDMDEPKIAGELFRDWFVTHTLDYTPDQKILKIRAILNELKSDIPRMIEDETLQKDVLNLLNESLGKPKNETAKSAQSFVEKTSEMFAKANDVSGKTYSFIEKAEKLGPYIGVAAGWVYMLFMR